MGRLRGLCARGNSWWKIAECAADGGGWWNAQGQEYSRSRLKYLQELQSGDVFCQLLEIEKMEKK